MGPAAFELVAVPDALNDLLLPVSLLHFEQLLYSSDFFVREDALCLELLPDFCVIKGVYFWHEVACVDNLHRLTQLAVG